MKDWSVEKADRVTMSVFGFIFLIPIVLIAAVLVGYALFSAFGWLATMGRGNHHAARADLP
jgi:hypothetical protein